jgi:hypothetical protein
MKDKRHRRRNRKNDRGSALLVSLMVMVGLSLLGLGFVAISETESTIAKNQSQALQTLTIAEAGAKMVVEWFQDPQWAINNAGMPGNANCANFGATPCSANGSPGQFMKTVRTVGDYVGVYKPTAGTKICDKPYRPSNNDRLFGDEDHADLIINATTVGQAQMNTINDVLLGPNADDKIAGEVTEVRVFAPPIVGGTLVNGFWGGGQRYGVATIRVTAQQFRDPVTHSGVISSHTVRVVVGELPLPIPAGPIQGNASVSFGGDFFVHWGMETSRTTLDPSRALTSMPWSNAYERPHFEHGYEPGTGIGHVLVTARGTGYSAANPPTITFSSGAAAATPVISGGGITAINVTTVGSGYSRTAPPTVNITCNAPCTGTGAVAQAMVGAEYYYKTGGAYDQQNYFEELLDKTFDDPWYGARAAGDNLRDGSGGGPQLYPYTYQTDEESASTPSYFFQFQDHNAYPLYKAVVFPTIRYDYWKRIAQQGRGYKGLYYFGYDGAGGFKKFNTGASQPMSYWANTLSGTGSGLGPGVYFFDTTSGQNPQTLTGGARTAALTPDEIWNSGNFNHEFLMQGFVYMNSNTFGTNGGGNSETPINVNMPGEPYRDVGYPVWCLAVGNPIAACTAANTWADCNGDPCRAGAGDATFSCQDLQTGLPHTDGRCRIVVMPAPAWESNDPNVANHAAGNIYIPKTWKSAAQAIASYGAACVAPPANWDGTQPAGNYCSEPHEPYINLVFPDTARDNNNHPSQVHTGWEAPSSQTYRSKKLTVNGVWPPGTPVSCGGTPSPEDCTSNGYDLDGAVVPLEAILYGILYNEGQYSAQGNVNYFGSVLIQDDIGATGTADVWFDEKLIKGSWAPPKMPRVIVFNEQTDEQSP